MCKECLKRLKEEEDSQREEEEKLCICRQEPWKHEVSIDSGDDMYYVGDKCLSTIKETIQKIQRSS